jgi:hypothetical protein
MRAVLKTNDPVDLSYAQALLADAGIENAVFDAEASVMDGSAGMLPRRLMVANEDFSAAIAILRAGLNGFRPPDGPE